MHESIPIQYKIKNHSADFYDKQRAFLRWALPMYSYPDPTTAPIEPGLAGSSQLANFHMIKFVSSYGGSA